MDSRDQSRNNNGDVLVKKFIITSCIVKPLIVCYVIFPLEIASRRESRGHIVKIQAQVILDVIDLG